MNSILLIRPEYKIMNEDKTIEIRWTTWHSKVNTTIGLAYCGPTIDKIIATAYLSGYKQYKIVNEYKSDIHKHWSYHEKLPHKKTYQT